jgi:multidrug efflux pump subunit AcrB
MNITDAAIQNRTVTYFAAFLLFAAGIASYFSLGQLEDPDFTVKVGLVITLYPGASPEEVELEVTNQIELAIQEMPQLDRMESWSRAGLSIVKVWIKQEFWADRLPQVWDEMRKKIRDIGSSLPPGVASPNVIDDFSFVYGFVLAATGDGLSYAELEAYVKDARKELSLVPGVARVELWGVQPKVIYLDATQQQLSELGLSAESFLVTLATQNMVLDAGGVGVQSQRLRIDPTGSFENPEDIGRLLMRQSLVDTMLREGAAANDASMRNEGILAETIALGDVVTVRPGYLEPPLNLMRYQGQPAIGISIANVTGGNIVDTGRALDARLAELQSELPVGVELSKIAWQSDLVTESIDSFMVNLLEAVAIVFVVLTLSMGWRMGVIISTGLVLTILGTFVVMAIQDIALQRVSLGALIIALGMMVDNAIVVADGMAIRMQKGMGRREAAVESASRPAPALLGATVIAVMAFYPIYSSKEDAGEYAASLFVVVAISLLWSWLLALTVTPLQCMDMLPDPDSNAEGDADPYTSNFYVRFRSLLAAAIGQRWVTMAGLAALLAVSLWGFRFVDQLFFTDATRRQFMIDYWAPEGTRIQDVSEDLRVLEEKLAADERVTAVSTFIGGGPPRFYLPIDPELPTSSYAQIIVNTAGLSDVYGVIADLEPWVPNYLPRGMVRFRRYTAGPGNTWQFEARFSGPAAADLDVLRALGEQGKGILEGSAWATDVRVDMRQRSLKLVPEYDQARARWAAVSRPELAEATRRAYDGLPVGLYREGEDLYPIVLRHTDAEREEFADGLDTLQIVPAFSRESVPLAAVVRDISLEWEDPIIMRSNRRRAISVQASPKEVTFPALYASVIEAFEAIELPPGYSLDWFGEFKSTADSQRSLIPGVVPSLVIVVFILVLLFNSMRAPMIILLVIPFAAIGVTGGLLVSDNPFSFMALLGAMSLAGMMIKNSIVLLDEIKDQTAEGKKPYDAVVDSAVARLRPVLLAAATTVLGVMPLLQDIFWVAMSVTIMAGLTFGTALTMVVVPVLYSIFYRVEPEEQPQT